MHFGDMRRSLPSKCPQLYPPYWEILDLTSQHNATKAKFTANWDDLQEVLAQNVNWEMVKLSQTELDLSTTWRMPRSKNAPHSQCSSHNYAIGT
ncbi:hypothetical protein BC938DRAFT_471189 [Jimgerdemannia flammicorona]|uniref:Uncharacterized protein n=1 Tax=Jimgerdemannia flammicorona TaxID=994334 RepID=A0A433Q8M3_9FUNG|nr:hypothetical protein BC938DRAFT_471189 [Jimgerdemannia flammicorona]